MDTETTMHLEEAYALLKVNELMTRDQIQSVYYQAIRGLEDEQLLDRLAHAWHAVCERSTAFSANLSIGGREFPVLITEVAVQSSGRDRRTLILPLDYCLQNLKSLRDISLRGENEPLFGNYDSEFIVVDGEEQILRTSDKWELQRQCQELSRTRQVQGVQVELKELRKRLDGMSPRPPVDHPIHERLHDVDNQLRYFLSGWGHMTSYDKITQALARFRHELDRLSSTDPVEAVIEQLMSGTIRSAIHPHNQQVAARINAASVQTNGFIDPFFQHDMEEFYRQNFSRFDDPWSHVNDLELMLRIDDYAPSEVINDPSLESAPAKVSFPGNRGEVEYEVTYFFDEEGGPAALVVIPFKSYRRHEPSYGRAHSFPALPYGIVWHCAVEFNGRIVANGLVSEELSKRLDKWERAKARSKHSEQFDTLGDGLFGAESSSVPPWHKGKVKPGSRRR